MTDRLPLAPLGALIAGLGAGIGGACAQGIEDLTPGAVIEVPAEQTVDTDGSGVVVGDDALVIVDGSILAGDDGVVGGADLQVQNSGLIQAGDEGISADDEDGLTVTNSGTIQATGKAITADDGSGASLNNFGVVISGDEGFEAGDGAQVNNQVGAEITAVEDALQVGGSTFIVNEGTILSTGEDGDGVDMDGGDVTNMGMIMTMGAAAIDFDADGVDGALVDEASVIRNEASGTIQGVDGILVDPDNTAAQIVFNAGTIRGTGGTALDLGAGEDFLEIEPGSVVDGDTLFGAGDDDLLFSRDVFEMVTDAFGLFDGGEGSDRASLFGFLAESATATTRGDGVLDLTVVEDGSSLTLSLANFEEIEFDDAVLSPEDLSPAVIPLPAGLPLLAAGLGGLALLRRRGARRADA